MQQYSFTLIIVLAPLILKLHVPAHAVEHHLEGRVERHGPLEGALLVAAHDLLGVAQVCDGGAKREGSEQVSERW